MSKILDDYEKSDSQNADMEEDIKALGVLTFTGSHITFRSTVSKANQYFSWI